MKKLFILLLTLTFLLCGCRTSQNTKTEIFMDTACTITADCNVEVIDGVFALCENYDRLLGLNRPESEVSMLNQYDEMELSNDTLKLLTQAIYYCQKTGGRYDITITPAINLYDFEKEIAPTVEEAKRVLYKVGYNRIEIKGNYVDLHNTDINLNSLVKGFIADKSVEYLKANGAKNGFVTVDNSFSAFGKAVQLEIKKPASNTALLTLKLKNNSASTSSIYDACFEKDGEFYHHILDVNTGLPLQTKLASVTVLGENATECDVLSTVCLILGEDIAKILINQTPDYEAIFIGKDNSVSVTDGLKLKKNTVVYK